MLSPMPFGQIVEVLDEGNSCKYNQLIKIYIILALGIRKFPQNVLQFGMD